MAIKWRKVRHGFAVVRGLKVTQANLVGLQAAITKAGGTAQVIFTDSLTKGGKYDDRLKVKTLRGWRVARPGDVVVRGSDNHVFGVIKAENFQGYLNAIQANKSKNKGE